MTQDNSQNNQVGIELVPITQGQVEAPSHAASASLDDGENPSKRANCFVRTYLTLLNFITPYVERYGWVAKWVTLFLAIWTTVDMLLDGRQTHVFKTLSPFWHPQGFKNANPVCKETVLKACWDDPLSAKCNGTLVITGPDIADAELQCRIELHPAYFSLSLVCWVLPPVLFATTWVWMKVVSEIVEERKEKKREEEEAKKQKLQRQQEIQVEDEESQEREVLQVEKENSQQNCCDMFWSRVWKGLLLLMKVVFVLPLILILAVIASFAIVYIKLPSDLILNALANLGVGWAKRWMDFVKESKIGKSLELSGQTETQNRIMKLFEQLGEALPQIGLNITFYLNNTYYIWFTETSSILGFPTTLISMVFSFGSILLGLFNGVRAAINVYQIRPLMSGTASWGPEKVKKIIEGNDINVDDLDGRGTSALMMAMEKNNRKMVLALISGGANLDLQDSYNKTALIWAAENNNTELGLALISGGANLDLQDMDENTALIQTARNNITELGLALISGGAKLDLQTYWTNETALIWAAQNNNTELGLVLILKGANMDLQDMWGQTALIWAAMKNNTELGLALINKGAYVDLQDKEGKTALIWAAGENNKELGLALINKGANRKLQDEDGKTALDHAKTQKMRNILNSP